MKKLLGLMIGLLGYCISGWPTDIWTMERCLEYALTHNPDARIAEQRIAVAQAGL